VHPEGQDGGRPVPTPARIRGLLFWLKPMALTLALNLQTRLSVEEHETRLRVYQAMRAAGALDEAVAHYLISAQIIFIAEDRMLDDDKAPALRSISNRIRTLKGRYGLEPDEDWGAGKGPQAYLDLNAEYDRVWDEITAATFEEFDEGELAVMYRFDRGRFDWLFEQGRHECCRTP
jgi:hypothetical protein